MITRIKFVRSDQTMYAYDSEGSIIGYWDCRDDFVPGYNEYGEPRESLPNGEYNGPNDSGIMAEITAGKYGPAYGTFYLTTGDPRGRDVHGGGSGCEDPYAPYQGWIPTYGCLRMQNSDGEELAQLIMDSDHEVLLEVED